MADSPRDCGRAVSDYMAFELFLASMRFGCYVAVPRRYRRYRVIASANGVAMALKDHPNNAPGMPMLFPAWVDRLQLRYMNPVARRVARFMPTFAVIAHRGRKSGKSYETVVQAYRKGNVLAILLGHGQTDWVKNVVAAGEADVRRSGVVLHVTRVRVLPMGSRADGLPLAARLGVRRMAVLVGDIV